MAIEQFLVGGLAGAEAVRAISDALARVPGVRLVVVRLAEQTVRVDHDGSAKPEALMAAIRQIGYTDVAMLV